jgi:hypothetical protein
VRSLEAWKLGDYEAGRLESYETGKLGSRENTAQSMPLSFLASRPPSLQTFQPSCILKGERNGL